MREYRGKEIGSGIWRHGWLIVCENGDHVIEHQRSGYGYSGISSNVDPETVGQYTVFDDTNKVQVFSGDIVRAAFNKPQVGVVLWRDGHYLIKWYTDDYESYLWQSRRLEVIGNIHEHPHLLKGEET